mmetsp:Transcript_13711/g.35197  ORF Transcript_13711/g.35197 Transcript_13711/m.35197 type:complete len:251 (-) Transcript_13711:195-947(-)
MEAVCGRAEQDRATDVAVHFATLPSVRCWTVGAVERSAPVRPSTSVGHRHAGRAGQQLDDAVRQHVRLLVRPALAGRLPAGGVYQAATRPRVRHLAPRGVYHQRGRPCGASPPRGLWARVMDRRAAAARVQLWARGRRGHIPRWRRDDAGGVSRTVLDLGCGGVTAGAVGGSADSRQRPPRVPRDDHKRRAHQHQPGRFGQGGRAPAAAPQRHKRFGCRRTVHQCGGADVESSTCRRWPRCPLLQSRRDG